MKEMIMPRGVYERKNKKAKQPKPVNSTRSAAQKRRWARVKRVKNPEPAQSTGDSMRYVPRKSTLEQKASAELAQLNGFVSQKPASAKAQPTEQQALPLPTQKTDREKLNEIRYRLDHAFGQALSEACVSTFQLAQDEKSSAAYRMALMHVHASFRTAAEALDKIIKLTV